MGTILTFAIACGGGGGSTQPPPPATVGVTLTPSGASLWTGGTQTFQATVSGSANAAVTWSVVETAGGTLSPLDPSTARYTAPTTPGTFHVKAASVADPSNSAQAPVTVSVQPPPGACNGAALGVGAMPMTASAPAAPMEVPGMPGSTHPDQPAPAPMPPDPGMGERQGIETERTDGVPA